MTKTKTVPVVTPTVFDPYGNPSSVAPGDLIESSWGTAVADRVLPRFPTKAALDTYTATNGTLAITLDQNFIWLRNANIWRATAMGNVVNFRTVGGGPGQNIAAVTPTVCAWTTEQSDPYNLVAGGVFTVPIGWDGRWSFEYSVYMAPGGTGDHTAWLAPSTGGRYAQTVLPQPASGNNGSYLNGVASMILAGGTTVAVYCYTTVATQANASTDQYFQGYFQGTT